MEIRLGSVCHRGGCLHFSITPLIGILGLTQPPQKVLEGHHNFSLMSPLISEQNLVLHGSCWTAWDQITWREEISNMNGTETLQGNVFKLEPSIRITCGAC